MCVCIVFFCFVLFFFYTTLHFRYIPVMWVMTSVAMQLAIGAVGGVSDVLE